jgi:hypothetical protein
MHAAVKRYVPGASGSIKNLVLLLEDWSARRTIEVEAAALRSTARMQQKRKRTGDCCLLSQLQDRGVTAYALDILRAQVEESQFYSAVALEGTKYAVTRMRRTEAAGRRKGKDEKSCRGKRTAQDKNET